MIGQPLVRVAYGALVVVALGGALLGCGPLVTGVVVGVVGNDSGGSSTPVNAAAKVATASVVGDTGGGTLDLQFVLQDAEGDDVTVALRYTTDPNDLATALFPSAAAGAFLAAGTPIASPLPATVGGATYSFVWDTAGDLGATLNQGNVRLQIVLDGEVAYTTNLFSVDNTQAPLVTAAAPTGLPALATTWSDDQFTEGAIPIDVVVADADAQPVTIAVTYSVNGGATFAPAAGSFYQGTQEFTAGGTLATTPGGVGYTFRWASALNGVVAEGSLVLRFQASDSQTGAPRDTAPFAVNNASLSAFIDTPDGIQVDRVEFDFILLDGAGGNLDVQVEFSVSGVGGPYHKATEAEVPGSDGTQALEASQTGTGHEFVWNAFHDLTDPALAGAPIHASNQIALRVRAVRRSTQVASLYAATAAFSVDDRLIRSVFNEGAILEGGEPAVQTVLPEVNGVAASASGIALSTPDFIAYVDRSTGLFQVIGGGGGDQGTGIPALDADLSGLSAIALDSNGNVYAAQRWPSTAPNQPVGRVIRIDATTGVLTTLASTWNNQLRGVALDEANGRVYFLAYNGSSLYELRSASTQSTAWWDAGTYHAGGGAIDIGTLSIPKGSARFKTGRLAMGPYADTLIASDASGGAVVGINLTSGTLDFWGSSVGPESVARVAGDGTGTSSQPGPAPLLVGLRSPRGLRVDTNGDLLVCEHNGNRLWRFTAAGSATVAGQGSPGFSGDGGLATEARLWGPIDVAVDGAGDLFVADRQNFRVRQVDAGGIIDTVVGSAPSVGDGGLATDAVLDRPMGVGIDPGSGDLYITSWDQARIRRVDGASGIIETYAGNGVYGESDAAVATDAWVRPTGIVMTSGSLIFSQLTDPQSGVPQALTVRVGVIGGGVSTLKKGGWGMTAALALAGDRLLVASFDNGSGGEGDVWLYNMGSSPLTVGGIGIGPNGIASIVSSTDTIAAGVAWHPDGDRFYYSTASGIEEVDLATLGATSLTLPGTPEPQGLLCDGTLLYYVDSANHQVLAKNLAASSVRRHGVVIAPGATGVIAGNGVEGFSGDGGPATGASLAFENQPSLNLALDSGGALYFCDLLNDRVRRVDSNGIIETVAGGGALDGDGSAAPVALLTNPTAIAAHSGRRQYYVMDQGRLRTPTPTTLRVSTVAGRGNPGFPSPPGPATRQSFRFDPEVSALPFTGTLQLLGSSVSGFFFGDDGIGERTVPAGSLVTLVDTWGGPLASALVAVEMTAREASWETIDLVPGHALSVSAGNYRCLIEPLAGPRGVDVRDVDLAGGGRTTLAAVADTLNHAVRIANLGPQDFPLGGGLGVLGVGNMRLVGGTVDVAAIGSVTAAIPTALLAYPYDVALTSDGVVVVADTLNRAVHAVNLTTTGRTLGGVSVPAGSYQTLTTRKGLPLAVAVDGSGRPYWSESPTGIGGSFGVVQLDAGSPFAVAQSAPHARGVGVASGWVYASDPYHHIVDATDLGGGGAGAAAMSVRVAGTVDETVFPREPDPGDSGDLGLGTAAQLFGPIDLAVSTAGDVWILDVGNLKVRRCRRFP